jgi:mannose-1-phosphate guanylyltransferase
MLHAIIMAGGSGTRLWPESRAGNPKQLLKVQGDRSLIQSTVDRLGRVVAPDRILIVTRRDLVDKIHAQLPDLARDAILAEPCPRNTAPCIGLAAIRVLQSDPDAVMAVMPADQVITPSDAFQAAILSAAALVEEDPARLVTFGVRPHYPSTGFGYIERGDPVVSAAADVATKLAGNSAEHAPVAVRPAVYRVARFHEKPTQQLASEYVASERFYWNAGIFVWKAAAILDAIGRYRPELYGHLKRIEDAMGKDDGSEVLEREFAAAEKISIDYAVMEKAEKVVVIEAPFAWDDVGSWLAIERHRPADANGNLLDAPRTVAIDARWNMVRGNDPKQVIVLAGVENLAVIVTPDGILVADKRDEKSIAAVTEELKRRGWTEYL